MRRFDEIELQSVPLGIEEPVAVAVPVGGDAASRIRRLLALLTDLSLFAAISMALLPLLPSPPGTGALVALSGFVLVVSYYYFAGCWLLWGKTVGGAIFDVRVASANEHMSLRQASVRWAALLLSIATGGLGFMLAALPSRRSLPDLMSDTHCVSAA
jgi:uncharacterized RDD family membrane protein YckC